MLTDMTLMREGEPVYAPPAPGKFHATNYGPLFYMLGSRLVDPHEPAFFPMRIVAMVGTLALAAACGLLGWWVTRSYTAAVLSSMMFLAYRFVTVFATPARPDSVALLFGFSGFLVAYKFRESRRILWSVPLIALGVYYKPQFVAAPLAILLFLMLERRYRVAMQFVSLLGVAGLSILAVFELLVFRHQAFLLHFVTYNLIPFSWYEGLVWLRLLAIVFLIPCLMALWSLRLRPDKLLACYFGWAVLLLPIMIAKKGAQMNYCLEVMLVVCPLVAALVTSKIPTLMPAVPLIYLLGMGLLLAQYTRGGSNDPAPQDFTEERAVQAFLRQNFPSQTPALGYFTGDLFRAGLGTPFSDLYQYSWLVCNGKVKDVGLVDELEQRRFGVILLTTDLSSERATHDAQGPCITEPFHRAILQNYRLARTFEFHLWEQKHYYAWVRRAR